MSVSFNTPTIESKQLSKLAFFKANEDLKPFWKKIQTYIAKNYESPNESYYKFSRRVNGIDYKQSKWRDSFSGALKIIFKKVATTWMCTSRKILEIGAGELDAKRNSHFMNLLPKNVRGFVLPTDISYVDPMHRLDSLQTDVSTLSNSFETNSFKTIIGACVLDTLPINALPQALKEIRQILEDKGTLLHIRDREPLVNTLFDAFLTEDCIFFPFYDHEVHFKGIKTISKETLLRQLDTTDQLDSDEKEWLKWFAECPANFREYIFLKFMAEDNEDFVRPLLILINWLNTLPLEGLETVENAHFFEQRFRNSIKENGFEILCYENRRQIKFIRPIHHTLLNILEDAVPFAEKIEKLLESPQKSEQLLQEATENFITCLNKGFSNAINDPHLGKEVIDDLIRRLKLPTIFLKNLEAKSELLPKSADKSAIIALLTRMKKVLKKESQHQPLLKFFHDRNNPINCFSYQNSKLKRETIYVLAPGVMLTEAVIELVVAKKIPQKLKQAVA